jgi:molecular chaperone GrpE
VIESLGQKFDPEFHQAMGEMVTGDVDPGCVAQEMQKAYILNDRLLRPALVMVAKSPESATEETDKSEESEDPDADSGADVSDE